MKNILSLFLLFISLNTFSQKETNFWYFGENAGLDFSTNLPTAIDGTLSTDEGSASISDANGVLQFYTDGTTVFSRDGSIMNNGNRLLGNSSSAQSAIIVPKPLEDNIYYIFTVGNQTNGGGNGVAYSEVNMLLNGGQGAVTAKNIFLNGSNNTREKITSVVGINCNTFWVITSDENSFYSYLIDSNGVNIVPESQFNHNRNLNDLRGYLKLSPNGKLLVNASASSGAYLYDFDAENGIISNERNLNIGGDGYGVEFSRDSKQLYISTGTHSQFVRGGIRNPPNFATITKFNLDANNDNTIDDIITINSSSAVIYRTNSGYRGALQLANNGKIYYARSRTSFLGVINFPESPNATDVNFIEEGVNLNGRISTEGLPPFIQSFFLDIEIKDEDTNQSLNFVDLETCVGETRTIVPASIIGSNLKYTWNFDNGTTETEIPTTAPEYKLELNNLQVANSGTYSLVITLEDTCLNTIEYNATFNLNVNPLPIVKSIDTYNQCDFDSNSTDGVSTFNLENLENQLTDNFINEDVSFFEPGDVNYNNEITNKIGYRNPLTKPFNHKLLVKITNKITGCFNTGEINLEVTPTSLSNYDDMYESELDLNATTVNPKNSIGSNDAIFNFDAKIDKIISENSSFNKTDFQFKFYLNKNDSENEINEIQKPYSQNKFTNNTKIFVRISKGNICAGIGEFNLFVNKLPVPQVNSDTITLCINNPIDSQLITTDLVATTPNISDTYSWYLNGNLITGENNSILKANKEGEYRVETIRYYTNNAINTSDDSTTLGYNTFTVQESNIALIESVEFVDNQDNTENNLITINVTGKGDYEYALNDNSLTSFKKGTKNLTYTFKNVPAGLNKVYIRDRNECGIESTKEISFIYFQRHFTPNEDGVYDTWKIQGVDNNFYTVVNLQIFDRFGKILKNLDLKTENGWNGIYNGELLPTNDYWYNAVLKDINGNIRKQTGHFSLIRK